MKKTIVTAATLVALLSGCQSSVDETPAPPPATGTHEPSPLYCGRSEDSPPEGCTADEQPNGTPVPTESVAGLEYKHHKYYTK